ncbi:unnamed protein product [Clavelina lepadiformis]|uniref:Cilia- and flagella-associated protein 221 n=1 Tax=Clavelina lepadiformis TaxID=159417 RepID=A0ABP0EYY1_CLALP
MAMTKTLPFPSAKNSKKQNLLSDLVAPRERFDVPNHILDTKIFSKLSQNSVAKIQPSVVHFNGYKLDKPQKTSIKICNCSSEKQNLHIIPPATKYFNIHYKKPDRFVPGFTIEITITFLADEWRYYYDCIRIQCKGEENLLVPLHAFPVMDTSKFPRKLVFPSSGTILGESCSKILPLSSDCPVEFEFQITILQSHPSFKVEPLSGVVPGEGKTNIHVTFTPTEYVTAHMAMQLVISQFNTKPLLCDVTASCSPTAMVPLSKSVRDLDELYRQTKLLDPRCISPIQIARRRQKDGRKIVPKLSKTPAKEFEHDGLQFPTLINSQHAVNSVLIQKKGKRRVKDLREDPVAKSNTAAAVQSSESMISVENTRQMKEAAFERIVRQDVVEERANQLRWQVHLGQDPMSHQAKLDVLQQRDLANDDYKFVKKKYPRPDEELCRTSTTTTYRRTWRKANQVPQSSPHFDLYKNNPWSVRHRALTRFQQAARTIVIRCRADKKVVMLRKMIEDFKSGLLPEYLPTVTSDNSLSAGLMPLQSARNSQDEYSVEDLLVNFTPETVKPFTFPVYVSPDTKDDIAPDALGEVPVELAKVNPKRYVPFVDLVVPRYYELAGYKRHDVSEAFHNYVPPGLARPLRTGAEDEIIQVTLPPHLEQNKSAYIAELLDKPIPSGDESSEAIFSKLLEEKTEVMMEPQEETRSSGLIPPSGLFKNPRYHKLHIFNPVPGVTHHYLPIAQTEVDPDYHLCPIPRYTRLPGANKFLDRKDVIKGMMSWKKFSSHGLGALAQAQTLTDVWLPRWSDCFSQGMIPLNTPQLLQEFPKNDEINLLDDEESQSPNFCLLTADMIRAQFCTEDELKKEWEKSQQEEGSKEETTALSQIPGENVGPTFSRDKRQAELEKIVQAKYDKLGEQIREHLKTLDLDCDT